MEPELVGQDCMAREWIWHRIWELDRIEEFPVYALGLVDVALWDLAGKLAGLPVHRPLGYFRESIPPAPRRSPTARSPSTSTSPTSAWSAASRRSSCTPGATPAGTPPSCRPCASTSASAWT